MTGSGEVSDEKDKPKLTAFVDGQQQAEAIVERWPSKEYPNMSKQGVVLFGSSKKHERLRSALCVRLVVVKTTATTAKEAFDGGLATDFTREHAERLVPVHALRLAELLSCRVVIQTRGSSQAARGKLHGRARVTTAWRAEKGAPLRRGAAARWRRTSSPLRGRRSPSPGEVAEWCRTPRAARSCTRRSRCCERHALGALLVAVDRAVPPQRAT